MLELGPDHGDTLRAYELVSQTRYAYKDRLVTSVELMDRLDELGFLSYEEEEEEGDEDDVAAVMTELVTQVYAIKAAIKANGSASASGGAGAGAGASPGPVSSASQASVSSKYITTFGDYLVFRQSHLTGNDSRYTSALRLPLHSLSTHTFQSFNSIPYLYLLCLSL